MRRVRIGASVQFSITVMMREEIELLKDHRRLHVLRGSTVLASSAEQDALDKNSAPSRRPQMIDAAYQRGLAGA